MIGKQTKGRGFRKLLDYLESREKAQIIGGNMSGRNARELAREFRVSRQLNPDADRVVYHVSLSAAKGDKLDDEKWTEIGERYMKEMGFDANQFVIFRHHNTDDDHIHIAASRIRMDTGLLVHDSWDYIRSEKILRQIEIDYDLVQVQGSREKLNRTPSTGQIRRIRREQLEYEQNKRDTPPEPSIKQLVQQKIDEASRDHPQMPLFIMRLQVAGVSVRAGFTRNGKSKGISYEIAGQAFSGSQLGAAYTWPGLQKHCGVDYQPQRDDLHLNELLLNPVKSLPVAEPRQPAISPVQTPTKPQFVPPPEDESLWLALENYLTQQRGLLKELVQRLHRQGLTYVDEKRNIVFVKRDLDGEKLGALVWSKPKQDNRCLEYGQNSHNQDSWFHFKLGKNLKGELKKVFLCSSPVDALSFAMYDMHAHKGLPPELTMYLAVDEADKLPLEFLKNFEKIAVVFNNDEHGHSAARAVMELLPHAKRLVPISSNWNQEFLNYLSNSHFEKIEY